MLSVTCKPFMLSVVMLNVVAPFWPLPCCSSVRTKKSENYFKKQKFNFAKKKLNSNSNYERGGKSVFYKTAVKSILISLFELPVQKNDVFKSQFFSPSHLLFSFVKILTTVLNFETCLRM
jgi:hypothetical protein